MGTVVSLNSTPLQFSDGYDALVVRENYTATDGGVTLDTTGFPNANIRSGHVIIKETADGTFKPMPISGDSYAALPGGHTYYGHAVQSVLTAKPFVGVTQHAKINNLVVDPDAGVYDLAPILTALKAALPHIIYQGDKA